MSLFLAPLLFTLLLGLAAIAARMTMNRLHVRLLQLELAGRSYESLSEHDRTQLNQVVNNRFHQESVGGKLATFVLLYAYPVLFISQGVFGRTSWRTGEIIFWSSAFYYTILTLVGYMGQQLSKINL